MTLAPLLALLLVPARSASLGGHEAPETVKAEAGPGEDRKALLDEFWQRGLLEPDRRSWTPAELEALEKIRKSEAAAKNYLLMKPGGLRPWVATRRVGGIPVARLTKAGYERYLSFVSQDALLYFERKGAGAKWAFKLTNWDGLPLFTPDGRITPEGLSVYNRARMKFEVYWRGPDGAVYGTRRPPAPGAVVPGSGGLPPAPGASGRGTPPASPPAPSSSRAQTAPEENPAAVPPAPAAPNAAPADGRDR